MSVDPDPEGEGAQNYGRRTSGQVAHREVEPDLAERFPNGRTYYYEGDDPVGFLKVADKVGLGRTRVVIHVPPDKLDLAHRFKLGT